MELIEGELASGDPVMVQLPLMASDTERKAARGVVVAIDGPRITVRLTDDGAESGDGPLITCTRDDIVPAPLAEVP